MKRKTIEKIPFLTLPNVHKKKTVKYVAVTDLKKIAGERHLFIEVYRNRKDGMDIPIVRIVLTKKDFGNFFPETGVWTRGRIRENTWSRNGLIWRDKDEGGGKSRKDLVMGNILHSEADEKIIRKFTAMGKYDRDGAWWEYVDDEQDYIIRSENRARRERKWIRRREALSERLANVGELPEQEILRYADEAVFRERHMIFYKKHGVRVTTACSECGGVTDTRWKEGMTYESSLEKMMENPVENHYGICPMCGAAGVFIPQGRADKKKPAVGYLFLGQRYKEAGFVLRYILVEKEWQLLAFDEIMTAAREKLAGVEIARVYFEPGKKIQKDYNKHNPYTGKDYWDDCNMNGMNNIIITKGKIMPETFEEMKDTFLRYSALKEYCAAETEDINPVYYLERYIQTPQIEMLVKMGLTKVVRELMACNYGIVQDVDAETPELFLGIRREHVKQLIRQKGNTDILTVMKQEKELDRQWTEAQIKQLAETGIGDRISRVLVYMGIQKFLNRVSKYAGCKYGTGCSTAEYRIQSTAAHYADYLDMRHACGYDMTNTVYLFPRDLDAAHREMVEENNAKELDIRIRRALDEYPFIKKHYRWYRKQFYFEDGKFMIRPARDAGEIIREGRILHHCVGGDNYLGRHNAGKSIILFLRFKDMPEAPYVTVEIDPKKKEIMQWYGAHDKKPDRTKIQKWLDAYVTRLKCGPAAAGQDTDAEMMQSIMMPAM